MNIAPPGPVIQLKQGNSIVLSCSAECSPACTFKWLKDSVELPTPLGLLTLNEVDRESQGAYTCQASNSVGTGARDIVLDIQCEYSLCLSLCLCPVSYTHLTLPTTASV